MQGLYKHVQPGQVFSVVVAIEVGEGSWKAKVVHGHHEDESAYGYSKESAKRNLREQIEKTTDFKGWLFLDLETN